MNFKFYSGEKMVQTKEQKQAYMKAYNDKRKEKTKAYHKAQYAKNKEKKQAYREKHKEQIKAYQKAYRAKNKEKTKALRKVYIKTPKGIKTRSISHWKQSGVIGNLSKIYDERYLPSTNCEVCNKEYSSNKDRHLDHDHTTGLFRQILCQSCNTHDNWKNIVTCQPCNMPNNWRNIYNQKKDQTEPFGLYQ